MERREAFDQVLAEKVDQDKQRLLQEKEKERENFRDLLRSSKLKPFSKFPDFKVKHRKDPRFLAVKRVQDQVGSLNKARRRRRKKEEKKEKREEEEEEEKKKRETKNKGRRRKKERKKERKRVREREYMCV